MGVHEKIIEKDAVNGAHFSRVGIAFRRVGLVVREVDWQLGS